VTGEGSRNLGQSRFFFLKKKEFRTEERTLHRRVLLVCTREVGKVARPRCEHAKSFMSHTHRHLGRGPQPALRCTIPDQLGLMDPWLLSPSTPIRTAGTGVSTVHCRVEKDSGTRGKLDGIAKPATLCNNITRRSNRAPRGEGAHKPCPEALC